MAGPMVLLYVQLRLIRESIDTPKSPRMPQPYISSLMSPLDCRRIQHAPRSNHIARANYSVASCGKIPAIIKHSMLSLSEQASGQR